MTEPVVFDPVTRWPAGREQSIGQAGEFLVWAHIITQSGGGLHVFLPILDRGLDAVVHRISDGAYLAVAAGADHGRRADVRPHGSSCWSAKK